MLPYGFACDLDMPDLDGLCEVCRNYIENGRVSFRAVSTTGKCADPKFTPRVRKCGYCMPCQRGEPCQRGV